MFKFKHDDQMVHFMSLCKNNTSKQFLSCWAFILYELRAILEGGK